MITGCQNQNEQAQTENNTEDISEEKTTEENTAEIATQTIYFEDIKVDEYVTLGEYKGLEAIQSKPEVTEEQINSFIQYSFGSLSYSNHKRERNKGNKIGKDEVKPSLFVDDMILNIVIQPLSHV